MVQITKPQRAADPSGNKSAKDATPEGDRLLTFREYYARIGSTCKTSHVARAHSAKGLIQAVRVSGRMVRYTESSIRALVAGEGRPA